MLRYEIVYTAASISMLNAGVAFRPWAHQWNAHAAFALTIQSMITLSVTAEFVVFGKVFSLKLCWLHNISYVKNK